jgi:hypothetical protein
MGGFVTCIKDAGFANPAFAGTLTERTATGHVTWTDFDSGLNLRGAQVSAAFPLRPNREGFEVTAFQLRTIGQGTVLTAAGPTTVSLREDDASLDYGRRLGRQWTVGMAVSPLLRTDTDMHVAATGALLGHLHSKAHVGARLGGTYATPWGGCAGFVYDYYTEDVTGTGLAFGPGVSARFTSREAAIGLSQPLGKQVLGALEWQQLGSSGAGAELTDSGWRVGLEVKPSPDWSVRVGDDEGAFATGLGLQRRAWSFEYAYVRDWNKNLAEASFGDSNTSSFEVRYAW